MIYKKDHPCIALFSKRNELTALYTFTQHLSTTILKTNKLLFVTFFGRLPIAVGTSSEDGIAPWHKLMTRVIPCEECIHRRKDSCLHLCKPDRVRTSDCLTPKFERELCCAALN